MFESHSQAVYKLLRDRQLVETEQLEALQEEHKAFGRSLADLAVDLGLIEKSALLGHVAQSLGWTFLAEPPASLAAETIAMLPANLARTYGAIPLWADAQSVDLLAVDPFNSQIIEDLTFALGRDVRLVVGDPARIEALIKLNYGEDEASLDELLREIGDKPLSEEEERELSTTDIEAMAGKTPIIRFVNLVLG